MNPKTTKNKIDDYFKNYDREAWLKIRKARYKQIRGIDNNFYLDRGADVFKKEVLQFWELGYSYKNSKIRKKNGEWINFQNEDGETIKPETILEELEKNNLELHGNYSWSMMFMGGDITVAMQKLKNTLNYLFDESIDIEKRFFEVVDKNGKYKIQGMSHGKASAFLHIRYPNDYGVWNSCTNDTFKILSNTKDGERFNIRESNCGKKYKKINELLKWLFENYKKQDKNSNNSNYGFENLSDVDIFVWYLADKFKKK